MKKKILFILLFVILLTGCSGQEQGAIEQKNTEVYYYKTDYYQQPFIILMDTEVSNQVHQVVFAIDDEIDYSNGLYAVDLQPNTVISCNIEKEQYDKQIAGLPVFYGTFSVYTVVFPGEESAKYCTVVTDVSTSVQKALTQAKKEEGTEHPFDENYLKKWKFIWYKL